MNAVMSEHESATLVAEMFDHFCSATTMRQVLGLYRNMCDIIGVRPGPLNEFYPKFKAKIRNWKAQALWKKFDARASHRVYSKGEACNGVRVLVIGAGPCGLRAAIEAQLCGAKVVVVEKRDRISRNNVLHLWPFLITDLKALGAKKFYGKFCAGSIDHISIRQLQCMLMKVALLLGVEIHEGISFIKTIEPKDGCGWRASVSPEDHAVSHYEFDVLIGADGKRNTLEGFRRKEFRGKLAIAITANFINKKTEAEAKVEEISGVAFIFNQSFFKELYQTTGIDLENIVYYKDETHYFVMTAKKHSLIDKGVIIQDFSDPAELLASVNVDTNKLLDYAKEAAGFSTKYQMPNLEFAVNHYGKPDVAMFDFTSMFAADNSCRITVRKNYRLLSCLVGDSLLEPFWPTGSGCARGFLSSMDAAYAIKLFSNNKNSSLAVLAQRESIYRLLAQTTPENLHRDIGAYTLDPSTRYPNLNKASVNIPQIKHLLDTDDPALLEQTFLDTNVLQSVPEPTIKRKRRTADTVPLGTVLLRWIKSHLKGNEFIHNLTEASQCFTNGRVLCALINRYRPDLVDLSAIDEFTPEACNEHAFNIFEQELGIPRLFTAKESLCLENIESKAWLNYLEQICEVFRGEIPHVKHPKLDFAELKQNKQTSSMAEFSRLQRFAPHRKPIEVAPVRKVPVEEDRTRRARKVENSPIVVAPHPHPHDTTPRRAKKRRSYDKVGNIDRDRGISTAYPRSSHDDRFSDRIRSMEQQITSKNTAITDKKPKDLLRAIGKIDSSDWNVKEIEKKIELSKKTSDIGKSREKVPKWSREQFLARQNRITQPDKQGDEKYKEIDSSLKAIDKQLKEGHNLDTGERGRNKVASIAGHFVKNKDHPKEEKHSHRHHTKAGLVLTSQGVSEVCHFCKQRVYLMEKISAEGLTLHRSCLKCHHCHTNLRLGGYAFDRDNPEGRFYCTQHYKLPPKLIKPAPKRSLPRTQQTDSHKASQMVTPEKQVGITNLDLLDRGETPERIEFENIDEIMSDGETAMDIIDENEWTDRNFGTESEESEEEPSSSDDSESDSDSDIYEDPAGSPLGAQTLQLASDWIDKRYSNMVDSDDDFYEYSSEDDDAESQTEGEEFVKAREMRRQEVKLMPPPTLPTDTETEGPSDLESSSSEINSATEISTDSEFEQDPITKAPPKIFIDDTHLRKPTRVQVKQGMIESNYRHRKYHHQPQEKDIHLEFKPLVEVDPSIKLTTNRQPLKNPRPGDYLLSKTASTEGIASKKSLELKKRYLLGETGIGGGVLKSGSTSALDSKFKSFHSNISECQKLLNPSAEISTTMQTFLKNSKLTDLGSKLSSMKKELENKDSHEKENVYDGKLVIAKNEINLEKIQQSESINTALVENKLKDITQLTPSTPNNNKIIETIDLITPEKKVVEPITELSNKDDKLVENKNLSNLKHMFIDLTADSPACDRSLVETTLNFSFTPQQKGAPNGEMKSNIPDIISCIKIDNNDNNIEEQVADQRPRSPVHETSIAVPNIPWNDKSEEIESDSLSESSASSTSSVEDIPHFILDSTTSPETLNGGEIFVPRLEIRDTTGELMQIDSLMIIDGQYIGDPEDLKVSEKLPEGTTVPSQESDECSKDSIIIVENEIIELAANTVTPSPVPVVESNPSFSSINSSDMKTNCDKKNIASILKPYQSFSTKKSNLKFDTRNENMIDTLKNMPFIIKKDESVIQKPKNLQFNAIKAADEDADKTPMAAIAPEIDISDSETEITGQNLTETELSDWTADDAVSENFVDIEFALNSNKGTIKRNKKTKQKMQAQRKNYENMIANIEHQQSHEHGIIKNLDIEDIEFMDTGSEDESCLETYSTTNKAMLKNRGYIEFVDTNGHNKNNFTSNNRQSNNYANKPQLIEAINKQVPGIDYIEQGACLLSSDNDLKTPMNEEAPKIAFDLFGLQNRYQTTEAQPDSLNDIEEDSLIMVTSSQCTVTTEESDALTVVTSPLDSSPQNVVTSTTDEKTISGSPVRKISSESSKKSSLDRKSINDVLTEDGKRKDSLKNIEDVGYDEYVKRLQHKIAQISNARDSLDVKKSKRKSSKGELISEPNSVIVGVPLSVQIEYPNQPLSIYMDENVIEAPKSVGKKIEEITKERVKQKDIIHDLVMDKLQTKKLLNAEKRLNRSRNRSNMFGQNYSNQSSPVSLYTANCESFPHYHPVPPERKNKVVTSDSERLDSKNITAIIDTHVKFEDFHKPIVEPHKLSKTQSFNYSPMKFSDYNNSHFKENIATFSTPIPPPRCNKKIEDTNTLTDQLREDARARARLKSNQALGLSPEDRMLLLRKKYHVNLEKFGDDHNKSDDMKFKERKLMSSKSVNDISAFQSVSHDTDFCAANETISKLNDYISDPNLTQPQLNGQEVCLRNRSKCKDRERRKSIIEKVSDFFNKKKDSKDNSPIKEKTEQSVFGRFRISTKAKDKSKDKEGSPYERCLSEDCLKSDNKSKQSSPIDRKIEEILPPPIPPLPLNYQRSDDESCTTNESKNELKKLRAMSKASRQAELKRLRIAQEIQREQEEIEVKIKDLETRGVEIEKELRGEAETMEMNMELLGNDESLVKEWLEIMRNITKLKVRDDELGIRQQELQLEHRHAQLKEELNMRLSCSKLDKNSSDVAAEGAILNEMLEIVAKRQALRPSLDATTSIATGSQSCFMKDSDV